MHARLTCLVMTVLLAATSAASLTAQAAPSNVAVAASRGSVTVSWTGIRNSEVTYRVLRAPDHKARGEDLTRPLAFDVTSFIDAAVAAGTSYFYQVVAVYGDGTEGASVAVQYPAPPVAVAPMPMATRQGVLRSVPLTQAPPFPLRAPAITATGQYNRVTISWQPVVTNIAPVSYEVRRVQVDPTTPGVPLGYITGSPMLKSDGSYTALDRSADLHLPTWYRLTTKNTSQGSVDSPWYRRDPPPHTGVDTIIGGYYRIAGPKSAYWIGCIRWSPAPGADTHWAKVKTGSGIWVNAPILLDYTRTRAMFSTLNPPFDQINAYLENGGLFTEVQVGGMFTINPGYFTDLNHLQPVFVNFTKSAVPLPAQ